ncbi:LIM domain-binding protein 1 [Trichonephila clavipes]|nr:LIM domain-binding protein 1 [Trichonephila clavipes]
MLGTQVKLKKKVSLTIGRTLIPRYFRSIFEGGVSDLSFNLKHPKESFHNTSITLDCDQCTMVTYHGKSMYNKMNPDHSLECILVISRIFREVYKAEFIASWECSQSSVVSSSQR